MKKFLKDRIYDYLNQFDNLWDECGLDPEEDTIEDLEQDIIDSDNLRVFCCEINYLDEANYVIRNTDDDLLESIFGYDINVRRSKKVDRFEVASEILDYCFDDVASEVIPEYLQEKGYKEIKEYLSRKKRPLRFTH